MAAWAHAQMLMADPECPAVIRPLCFQCMSNPVVEAQAQVFKASVMAFKEQSKE